MSLWITLKNIIVHKKHTVKSFKIIPLYSHFYFMRKIMFDVCLTTWFILIHSINMDKTTSDLMETWIKSTSQYMEDDSEWTSNIQTDIYYRHTERDASKTTELDYMYRDITIKYTCKSGRDNYHWTYQRYITTTGRILEGDNHWTYLR